MITLQLSEKHVQTVLSALFEQPMKYTAETWNEIQRQVMAQQAGPPSIDLRNQGDRHDGVIVRAGTPPEV